MLPGGDIPADFGAALQRYYPGLPVALVERLARAYGSAALEILGEARSQADLGIDFGATLSQREVDWLVAHEWAREVDDVLWRRSKLGLRLQPHERDAVARFVDAERGVSTAAE